MAIENLGHDFNIGSILRTANAFLAAEVNIVGRRDWNWRGAIADRHFRYNDLRIYPPVSALSAAAKIR